MARIRSIKPEFFDDRKLARCSRDARLLYIGMWNHCDEWSRVQGDPRWIKGQLFAYDDDVDAAVITKWLDELAADDIGAVVRYDVDGDPYLFLPKLARHQRLEPCETPSRLPAPPDFDEGSYLALPGVKKRSSRLSPQQSGESPDLSGGNPDESGPRARAHSRLQVAGSREQVAGSRETSGVASDAAPPANSRRGTRLPEDFAIPADQKDWFAENCPHVDVRYQHQLFVNYWVSKSRPGRQQARLDPHLAELDAQGRERSSARQ